MKCQLLNFLLSQAKMAIYLSWRNKLEGLLDVDAPIVFKRMLKARLKTDFGFYFLTNNVEEFEKIWCFKQVLCSVKNDELVFGLPLF